MTTPGQPYKVVRRAGGTGRLYLPGRVGIVLREVRANVRRLHQVIDAHDRRCCLCRDLLARPGSSDLTLCRQRVALVAAWAAEYDELQALEWLLGLRAGLSGVQLRDWDLLPEVARVGA